MQGSSVQVWICKVPIFPPVPPWGSIIVYPKSTALPHPELVTPIFEDLNELYEFLYSLHVFSAKNLKEILSYLEKGEISSKIAKELFDHVWKSDKSPSTLINELGLKQVTDEDLIEKLVEKIIADNPAQVEKAKLNPKILGLMILRIKLITLLIKFFLG